MPFLPSRALLTSAVLALTCGSISFGQFKATEPVPEKYAAGFNAINAKNAKEHLSVLAGTEFSGRGTGQEGFFKAARWYSEELAKVGFQPAGTDGSWFQTVPLVRTHVAEETQLTIAGEKVDLLFGMSSFIGESKTSGQIVFLNLSDTNADIGSAEQFAGKIIVYKAVTRRRSRGGAMPQALRDAKPAAMIRVTTRGLRTDNVRKSARSIPTSGPSISISVDDANKLAKQCYLAETFFTDQPKSNVVITTGFKAECNIEVIRETVEIPNVIGWYPGSDPDLKHEHVGLGAHLDHLGTQGKTVFPGADDNGSGSTALLQLAKAIHTNPVKPKRSIFLIVFCGEELGLLGSAHYADNPTKPLKDMVCMLNMDMVGRNEEKGTETAAENVGHIHLVGSKRISMELHEMTMMANKHVGFEFEYDEEGVYTRSDHANFAKKGIPITFVFGGFHPDYHKPTDTVDKIDFNKLVSAARLNYLCAMMAADHGHFARNEKADE